LLAGYRAAIAEAERLAREAAARRDRLRAVEQASRADREKVLAERREKRRAFERVAREVRASRKEIKVLRADEARLGRLVERIGRVLAGAKGASAGTPARKVEKVPEPDSKRQLFSALRGKL